MEVRFENLHIETEVYAETSRQLPSLWNAVRASVEVTRLLSCQHLSCRQLVTSRPAGSTLLGGQSVAFQFTGSFYKYGMHWSRAVQAQTALLRPCICVQWAFLKLHILRVGKVKMAILSSMSSIIKPGRATLVLGPPGAGKSTLLKALAGKLKPDGLKVPPPLLSCPRLSCQRMLAVFKYRKAR